MSKGECSGCKHLAVAYGSTWTWCNFYMRHLEDVVICGEKET